ncbi:hypothetical protein GCM10023163_01170 [Aestuariibaculum suncheonense]
MNSEDIQTYIETNKHQRICGHFKQSQLDSINLRIPSQLIIKPKTFHKAFLLTLLLVMGTTLMNCTNNKGNKQKIDSIEVIDTLQNKIVDSTKFINELIQKSSTTNHTYTKTIQTPSPSPTDIVAIETLGEIISGTIPEIMVDGELEIMGDLEPVEKTTEEDPIVFGMISETPPQFKETPKNLKDYDKKAYFSEHFSQIITENFNTDVHQNLKGIQRIYTRFKINKEGKVVDIQVRAPHPALEKEAIRVLKLLPDFIPATQRNKPVEITQNLPIFFKAGEE